MTLDEAVHKAVVGALTTALAPIPVYDEPPQDAPLPLVAVTGVASEDDDTIDGTGTLFRVSIGVVTAYEGKREVLAAFGAIRAALHDARPALDVGETVTCRVETTEVVRVPLDGVVSTQGVAVIAIRASDNSD